jgi:hypothetical protein
VQDPLEALSRRVDRLERTIRLQRGLLALAVISVAGAGVAFGAAGRAAKALPEVRASRIALVAADGRTLAALEPTANGGARLALFGGGDAPRISLDVASDSSRVSVSGAGKSAAALVDDGLGPRLAVSDSAGNDRAWLAVRLDSPVLQFLDPHGMARTGITTINDDSGLAVVSGTDGSRPGIVLLGDKRSVIWSAP